MESKDCTEGLLWLKEEKASTLQTLNSTSNKFREQGPANQFGVKTTLYQIKTTLYHIIES